jgi:hypothetical protein
MLKVRRRVAAVLLITATPAWSAPKVILDYALPKTRVAAGVAQVITGCPASADEQLRRQDSSAISFNYVVSIDSKSVPARLVSLDAHSAFLVDRSTKMQFNDDGLTLKQFNGSSTGQGGPLIASLIKAGAAAFGLAAAPLPFAPMLTATAAPNAGRNRPGSSLRRPATEMITRYYLQCRPEIAAGVTRLNELTGDIAALQAKAINGALDAGQTAILTQWQAEQIKLQGLLTLTVATKKAFDPDLQAGGPPAKLTAVVPAPDYDRWFEIVPRTSSVPKSLHLRSDRPTTVHAKLEHIGRMRGTNGVSDGPLVGLYGYDVTLTIDPKSAGWFSCGTGTLSACGPDDRGDGIIRGRELVYRRGVNGTVSLSPRDHDCGTEVCPDRPNDAPEWEDADRASGSSAVKFPQLSRLFVLPTGGSIFGSRTVAASFDANGSPTDLEYSIGSASKDLSSIVDATVAASQTVAGARLQASKTELDQLTTAQSLHDALAKQLNSSGK